jgi:lysophospholipase L1-like esterase
MTKYSRRHFLTQLGAFAGIAIAGRSVLSSTLRGGGDAPFDFLVVGDSLVWGQGLREEQKFYHLTKEWLEREVFKNTREVNLKVKAHSGASINLRQYETDALLDAEIGEDEFFHPEINLSFPSIRAQVEAARGEYENPQTVSLILLTGGITDIRLSVILNPLKNNEELKLSIVKHCNEKMFELLLDAAREFPNALIAVGGYYPFISKHTPSGIIFDSLLELQDVPEPLKSLINNPLNRRLLRRYRRKMVERSTIWAENSTLEFKKAIERLNAEFDKPRAVFIESPVTEENCIGTKNPLLFEIKKGKAIDDLAAERKSVCKKTLAELRKSTNLKLRTRTCELATVGHPNAEGAKAVALAIQEKLTPIFLNTKQ